MKATATAAQATNTGAVLTLVEPSKKKVLGDRALENRIRKIKALEVQKRELEAQITALKDEIRDDMQDRGTDEYKTPHFTIRFKAIKSNSFNTRKFKVDHPELYNQYLVAGSTMRLTIG